MTSLFDGVLTFIPTILLAQVLGLGVVFASYLLLHHRVKHP